MRIALVAACSALVCGCTTVPPLEKASGTRDTNIFIRDVVNRVKCELSDAFDAKTSESGFYWLEPWTVKVDLTLQVNNQAGITPTGSFTQYRPNAFNFDAGSSSLTNTTIGFVSQFFAAGAGVNAGEQAVRSEVITFSLALRELKQWRKELRRSGREEATCGVVGIEGLTAGLGLKEWVDSALYPIEKGDLNAGDHPTTGASKVVAVIPTHGSTPYAQIDVPIAILLQNAKSSASAAQRSSEEAGIAVRSANAGAEAYLDVLESGLKKQVLKVLKNASDISKAAAAQATHARAQVVEIEQLIKSPTADPQNDSNNAGKYASKAKADATAAAANAAKVKKLVQQLGKFKPDPPVDAILHSVQFVVTYGGSISPSWTLIQWKGPALSGPLVSGSASRTHILNIALGPRNGDQNRLIQNNTVLSVLAH